MGRIKIKLMYAVLDKKELLGIYDDEPLAQAVIAEFRPKAKIAKKYLNMKPIAIS